jgi:putative redox protein
MKDYVKINWKKEMAFEADIDGFKLMLDTKKEHGGNGAGPRPKPLSMISLAGCTGMDVVSILKKMRVELEDFSVEIEGDLKDEHPRYFTRMHIIYQFKGKQLPMEKLQKAIDLSLERYCGVAATFRKAMEITHEIRLT